MQHNFIDQIHLVNGLLQNVFPRYGLLTSLINNMNSNLYGLSLLYFDILFEQCFITYNAAEAKKTKCTSAAPDLTSAGYELKILTFLVTYRTKVFDCACCHRHCQRL